MDNHAALKAWGETVRKYMPHLSKPQAAVLALWSFGIVMTKSCGLTSIAAFLAELLGKKENTMRQRLREWYREAGAKKGAHGKGVQRQELDVNSCFAPLLKWVLSWWPAEERRLALALDASTLGARFVVLAISVIYRGCAIPVAWALLPANQRGAWKPQWLSLLKHLRGSVPADWTVLVLADRGLYARWLYDQIVRLHWHPFLRINQQGWFRPASAQSFLPLATLLTSPGETWSGRVVCFKAMPLACTLLAQWDELHTDPWLILTDLTPEQAQVCWYSLRFWIECGFKDHKRGGWQWQQTRITDPARSSRFWLAMALASLWVLSVGGEAETSLPASTLSELPESHIARRRATRRSQPRLLSCFRRGMLSIFAQLINGHPLPLGRFLPEPWPS